MSKKLKCFFPTLLVLNAIVSIFKLIGVYARMELINCIAEGQSNKSIVHWIALVVSLIFSEYITLVIIQAAEIKIKKTYKFRTVEVVADKCARLPLPIIEQQKTQNILYKAKEFYQKSIDRTQSTCQIVNCVLTLTALILALSHGQSAMILVFTAVIAIAFYACFKSSKQSFGFWSKYMSNARRYNYFSDVQTKREYAYERRTYNFSHAMDRRFSDAFDAARSSNRKNGLIRFYGQAIVEGITISISIFTTFYFASPDSLDGFTVGSYAAITELVTRLLVAVSECPDSIFTIREFKDLTKEILSFVKSDNEQFNNIHREKGDCVCPNDICSIFKDVYFSYPSESNEVISGFNYAFKKGVHYGLVGVNGSGKTTIAKLLLGLYDPTSGEIISSGVNKTAIFQDFQIYPVTVREYLLMGNNRNLPDEALLDILSRFECNSLKDGLNTPITLLTEEGTLLSKGQFQRLAIARTCLSDAEVVILDEPTASLDPISEKRIYETCMELLKGKTCIFISHRLGAVRNMDTILVLENGVLCEAGSHEDLMRSEGIYSKLYSTQRGMYIDE